MNGPASLSLVVSFTIPRSSQLHPAHPKAKMNDLQNGACGPK